MTSLIMRILSFPVKILAYIWSSFNKRMITVLPSPVTSPSKPRGSIHAYVPAPHQLPKTPTSAPTPVPTTPSTATVTVPVSVKKSPEQAAAKEHLRAKLHAPIPYVAVLYYTYNIPLEAAH